MLGRAPERVRKDRRARVGQRRHVARPPTDVAPHEIERSLKRGAVWAIGSQVAVQGIRFVSVVVLARLLTPSDYGAAAFAITLASFSMILGDLGYGTALVQAATASQRWASTACWCALGAGAVGSGLAALGAYPVALALGEPEVTGSRGRRRADAAPRRRGISEQCDFLTRSMSFECHPGCDHDRRRCSQR